MQRISFWISSVASLLVIPLLIAAVRMGGESVSDGGYAASFIQSFGLIIISALLVTWPLLFPLRSRIAAIASLIAWSPILIYQAGFLPTGDYTGIYYPGFWLAVIVAFYLRKSLLSSETWISGIVLGLAMAVTIGIGIPLIFLVSVIPGGLFLLPVVSVIWLIRSFRSNLVY